MYENHGWHPKNGKLLTWYETGEKRLECTYSNGRRIGTAIRYYPDGSPDRIYNYQKGKLHGKFEIFYADHSKFAEGKCVHGELDGEVICWDPETKKPEVTSVYENGVLIRGVEFDTMYQRWYRK